MAGCYGSHPFDQYWERELDKYLETQEDENEQEEQEEE